MSIENKVNVFVVEDEQAWQDAIRELLEAGGHSVVATARSLREALEVVDRLKSLGVGVATIDGNLTRMRRDGNDGRTVLKAIREKAPDVKTIGMSGSSVLGTDFDLGKMKATELCLIVRSLIG